MQAYRHNAQNMPSLHETSITWGWRSGLWHWSAASGKILCLAAEFRNAGRLARAMTRHDAERRNNHMGIIRKTKVKKKYGKKKRGKQS